MGINWHRTWKALVNSVCPTRWQLWTPWGFFFPHFQTLCFEVITNSEVASIVSTEVPYTLPPASSSIPSYITTAHCQSRKSMLTQRIRLETLPGISPIVTCTCVCMCSFVKFLIHVYEDTKLFPHYKGGTLSYSLIVSPLPIPSLWQPLIHSPFL